MTKEKERRPLKFFQGWFDCMGWMKVEENEVGFFQSERASQNFRFNLAIYLGLD